ncbi:MAG: glutamine synthetase [Rickettsiales bacterium]|jgi:glutamine synthetase|nr:glutamine synthetase [Rickettsiales bacterium]
MIISKDDSTQLLNKLLEQFKQLDMVPVIGAEIEFYLSPPNIDKLDLAIPIEKEKGENQFEVKTDYSSDIFGQVQKILDLREKITEQALKHGMEVDFSAKPFLDQPGSALHIHLHLENSMGDNLFIKNNNKETKLMLHSIAGLCSSMAEHMLIFAPYENAYLRYKGDSVESPSKICWGGNNRSAAIRIPLSEKNNRRIEHRVACGDASPLDVVCAIFYGVLKGIREESIPSEKLHGNAFLEQYDYPVFPQDYAVAKKNFKRIIL